MFADPDVVSDDKEMTEKVRSAAEHIRAEGRPVAEQAVLATVEWQSLAELRGWTKLQVERSMFKLLEKVLDLPAWVPRHTVAATVRLWPFTNDNGSDITATLNRIKAALSEGNCEEAFALLNLVFDWLCSIHGMHIMVGENLHGMDLLMEALEIVDKDKNPLRYYSSLAKLMHVLREMTVQTFKSWVKVNGVDSAKRCAARVAPLPISQRWGRIGVIEDYVLRCTDDTYDDAEPWTIPSWEKVKVKHMHLANVILPALNKRGTEADVLQQAERESGGLDEIRLEEMKDYSVKQSKWRGAAFSFVANPRSCMVVRMGRMLKGEMFHMFYFIQVRRPPGVPQALALLVWGKAAEFRKGFESLLEPHVWETMLADLPIRMRCRVDHLLTQLVLRAIANYEKRVGQPCDSFPAKLLWFGWGTPESPCPQRERLAKELIFWSEENAAWATHAGAPEHPGVAKGALHPTARKTWLLFEPEIRCCAAAEGRVSPLLFVPYRTLAESWRADSQDLEGVNSMISFQTRCCPGIKFPLVDARVGNRKMCGIGSRDTADIKWSAIKDKVTQLVEEAAQNLLSAKGVLAAREQFAVPGACIRSIPYVSTCPTQPSEP